MKIKLAILESDAAYLERMVSFFSTRYADKFEMYSFTNQSIAIETLASAKIDVFLASDAFVIDTSALPARCGFAYFVDAEGIETVHEQRAICKFQKVDLIYKQILSIYSEHAGGVSAVKLGDNRTKTLIFSSPCGGVGTSTMAASCAVYFAARQQKVLYLNFEKFGSSDCFFAADGAFDMSDVIYALKSKKTNLAMKLESSVKQDKTGVYFFSPTKVALDMLELSAADQKSLLSELQLIGSYDYVIVDMDFSVQKDVLSVYKMADAFLWVGDGSFNSNTKIQRTYEALSIVHANDEDSVLQKLGLLYNKFSNKTSQAIAEIGLRTIGGAPRYEHVMTAQVMEQLAAKEMFAGILS